MPVLLANATADAAGKATITFPAPGQGIAYCGTVIVPSTPGAATWTAVIGNATYGQWSGATSAGPFTENDQETLQLNGEGLTPGTTYVATWHITQGAAGSFRGVTPDVLPASVNITNASIKVAGSVDANITNATIPVSGSVTVSSGSIDVSGTVDLAAGTAVDITGPVTIETASGTPIDANVQGSLTSITDPVSVAGSVSVEGVEGGTTVGVAGTVDANITNATVTVETTGTSDVNVTNATIPVSGSVDATIDGPVAIGGGTIYVVNPFTGETLPSAAGSTTTGNATLSSTNYNLVAWSAVPLPAGSTGNLVCDSNLTNALASVGPTWTLAGASVGTSGGDIDVSNAGSSTAEFVYYADGTASGSITFRSQPIAVTPGTDIVASALLTLSQISSGYCQISLTDPADTVAYGDTNITTAGTQVVSLALTVPSGVTEVTLQLTLDLTSSATVAWSQIQLTETSAVQTYEPGPLWTYPVYGRGGYLGETTALAFQDTGGPVDTTRQPPGINSSYPQLPAPGAPTVTVEGTTGSTTYAYQVTAQSPNASAGTTRLAPNPGANIGTMDIAAGAKVEIAAGSAEIGTVDLAAGATVDATIQNATLDVTGSTINVAGATQATSTFGTVNASAQDTVTATSTTTSTTLIPAPSSTERLQLFGGTISSEASAGGGELQTTTGTVISLSPTSTAPLSLQYDGATLPAGEGVVIYGASATVPVSASLNYSVIPA